jgi:hypothetical protein
MNWPAMGVLQNEPNLNSLRCWFDQDAKNGPGVRLRDPLP